MKAMFRRLRGHPWWTTVVVAVVVVGAGAAVFAGTRSSSAATAAPTTTQTVATGTIKQSVSTTGTVAPTSQENLNFSVSGQVTAVKVKVGQTVTKGQTLATVDSASASASVAQAKATVASDQAKVDDDDTNGATDTQTAADQAALTAANNQLTSAKTQLAAATMTSPIDGVVASLDLTVGQSVSGSASSGSGTGTSGSGGTGATGGGGGAAGGSTSSSSSTSSTPQILVISTDSWIVNATVDASSVGLIKTGDQAQLTVTGATATVYGTIYSIGLVSSSTGTASYPVVVAVTGSPSGLHDGAAATGTLIYKQLSNVLVVPTTALHRTSSGGEYVEKSVNGKAVQTTVKVGVSSGGQTQITSGLAAGDKIIVPQVQFGGGANRSSGTTGGTTPGFPGGGAGGGFGGGAGGGFGGGAGGGFGGGGGGFGGGGGTGG
jgi:macrolide-specific efflux system membrane fusion protein